MATSTEPTKSEDWPPYKFIWSRWPGRPFTHVMRDHPGWYLGLGIPLVIFLIGYYGWRSKWPFLVGFALGFLSGHVWA